MKLVGGRRKTVTNPNLETQINRENVETQGWRGSDTARPTAADTTEEGRAEGGRVSNAAVAEQTKGAGQSEQVDGQGTSGEAVGTGQCDECGEYGAQCGFWARGSGQKDDDAATRRGECRK